VTRCGFMVLSSLISGCTVGWLDTRVDTRAQSGWKCPTTLSVVVNSGSTTNTFGPRSAEPERIKEAEGRYRKVAERTLRQRQCVLSEGATGEALEIRIEEMQQVTALPQEWLTGLSLGLIPSWGTRPGEVRFSFSQGARTSTYLVDDKRVNHLVLFPVFWLSFVLSNNEEEFTEALRDFATGL